ncbi:hypothetical protein HPP92_015138 [Vanilla planifolia]|uniref:Uncharacterized protein n=1 Tax=Vanilla planifolia TaxID=51239 RepID=A0A835QX71_VANPL|nr:hypothetical protein HPP92_015644 [Vanilla planifolia]KAG0475452.1 hypothetical protein HPP92_015138 [Vanilla planifolia]
MRRSGHYGDASVNPMMAAQMQHMSAQRMQYNSAVGHFPGRTDEEHEYQSSKAEGQWQWDRDGPKGSKPMSPHMYKEVRRTTDIGQGNDGSRSAYQGQRLDSKIVMEKQIGRDSRSQDDTELGYEENNQPQTYEALEERFHQDIMKLTKEQQEAEDKEYARHREKLNEINIKYQEKLVAIRSRQASLREEFLRKESLARHQQYQQFGGEAYGYRSATAPVAAAHGDPHLAFGRGNFDSYGERPEFGGAVRNHEFDSRGQFTGGRAFAGGRFY